MRSRSANPTKTFYSVVPTLTIVSINNPGGLTPILATDIAHFKPDILMIQESHSKYKRLILGNPRYTYLHEKYKYAIVSHYNSIYVYNKSLTLLKHDIQLWHVRMTISTPLTLGEEQKPNQTLIIQSLYAPCNETKRKGFFLSDGGDLRKSQLVITVHHAYLRGT